MEAKVAVALIFLLLVIYQLKHYLCDYPLQNAWMLGKFKQGWDFVLPLSAHCGVHALFTFAIAFTFSWRPGNLLFCLGLALFDFVVHFVMDRIKAGPKYLGRYKSLSAKEYQELWASTFGQAPQLRHNTYFWWALGFDQMVHHLTHYAIIAALVWRMG